MANKPEIRVVSHTDEEQEILQSELDRLGSRFPLADARITRSSNLANAAKALQRALPDLLVLNPETPRGDAAGAPRNTCALIQNLQAPVLVALRETDDYWARQAILRPNLLVWNWENDDGSLETLLPLLVAPDAKRCLSAVIRLRWTEPVCDIDIGRAVQFRDLRLNTGKLYRNSEWRSEDLQRIFDMDDRKFAWTALADKGKVLFRDILEELGEALMDARDGGAALDLRFEIDPDDMNRLFSLPIELLNREAKWENFFCRIAPMARRVRAGKVCHMRGRMAQPLVLYVDASATQGSMEVIGRNGALQPVLFPDLSAAVAKEQGIFTQDLAAVCRCEPLDPDGTSLLEALRRRLHDRSQPCPEIIHFTGHAITPESGGTELVFPGRRQGEVDRLSVGTFADWLPEGVRLVVLSACQGASVDTALRLHAAKGVAVLGFRCEVLPDAAADFVSNFYRAHLFDQEPCAGAYRTACSMGDVAQFAWAAAVLLDHN